MEYFVANSYIHSERVGEPFTKNGKLYTQIKNKCDRCINGIYPVRVENGRPIPTSVDGGVCYACGGTGYVYKEVRLYTAKEKATLEKQAEVRKAQNEKVKEARAADHRKTWEARNGFNEDHETYVVFGDTFGIKDMLKEQGYKFNRDLMWHGPAPVELDENYIVEKFTFDQLYAWGETNVPTFIGKEVVASFNEKLRSNSEFEGEIGERLDIDCALISMKQYSGNWGPYWTYVFKHGDNVLIWYTQSEKNVEIGEVIHLRGTVKDHAVKGQDHCTILSRCKFM